MKSTALIFVIIAGALNAEIPAGATDLVPRRDSPAAESLKIKTEAVVTMKSEITIISDTPKSSIDLPSIYITKDRNAGIFRVSFFRSPKRILRLLAPMIGCGDRVLQDRIFLSNAQAARVYRLEAPISEHPQK